MNIILISNTIKLFFMSIFAYEIYVKILNHKFSIKKNIIIILITLLLNLIYISIKQNFGTATAILLMYFILSYFVGIIEKVDLGYSIMIMLISLAMSVVSFVVSVPIIFCVHKNINIIFSLLLIILLQKLIIIFFFRIKRFKNGFSFLQNRDNENYVNIIMTNISILVIFIYSLFGIKSVEASKSIYIPFILICSIMLIMLQKTITLYYKQRLLEKTIDGYKSDIVERDEKIKNLSQEKFKISKLNHEFYDRQKSMELKVQELIKNANINIETASELTVIDQINSLTKEYSYNLEKIKNPDKLPTTDIEEIDDMFKYMQLKCKNNNIDFKLQINGNIQHMVNKIIPQNRLVTLIGDHIKDAIIAINSGDNTLRSIIAILGIKDNCYEFSVHDTGIEFEIETLLKLGLEPATTHKDNGGTGIGFITTFETIRDTRASLIIEEKHEMIDNDYTKAVIIRFDNKNEYRINSYRAEKIKENSKDNRIIIEEI